jgi:uncharacterized protein with von Willebrand factor type A (vWA) domain
MKNLDAPLIELFYGLRARQFPLGVGEYLLALRALAKGFGVGSREELVFMCQTLWAKSLDEQAQVGRLLEALLPKRLSAEELRALQRRAQEVTEGRDEAGLKRLSNLAGADRLPRVRVAAPPGHSREGSLQTEVGARMGGRAAAPPAPAAAALAAAAGGARAGRADSSRFDLVGSLPLTQRQMRQGWRYYRRLRRVGAPTELDVQATVEQVHRLGVLVAPVLVPRRRNLARVLVLADASRSMTPFRRVTGALLDSVQHGDLGGASLLFFNNVPGRALFREPRLSAPLPVQDALAPFKRAGILIISDGGAARGNLDDARVRKTVAFVQTLRLYTRSVAWLNPTPEARWAGTSAEEIRAQAGVPMFEVDNAGFVEAVEALRGRGR